MASAGVRPSLTTYRGQNRDKNSYTFRTNNNYPLLLKYIIDTVYIIYVIRDITTNLPYT